MLLWNCGLVVCIVVLEQNITVTVVTVSAPKKAKWFCFLLLFSEVQDNIGYKFSSHRILRSFDSLRISRTDRKKHFTRTYTSILTMTEIIDIFF